MRASGALTILTAVSLIALAGCGGGGGGGGTLTTELSGRVVDSNGVGMDGATVTADTGVRAIIQDITANGGYFTLQDVPVGTDFTLTVSRLDIGTRTYQDVQVDPSGTSGTPTMDVVISPSSPPAGSTISITPSATELEMGDPLTFTVQVSYGGSLLFPSHCATWTIIGGATGQVESDSRYFAVSPTDVGSTVKLSAIVPLADGSAATDSLTMIVVSQGEPEPPPLPPAP